MEWIESSMNEPIDKVIEAEDILADAQGCIECIFMASSELTIEGRNPFHSRQYCEQENR